MSVSTWPEFEELASSLRSAEICTVAPWQYYVAKKCPSYAKIVRSADVVLPDGQWLVLSMRLAGMFTQRRTGREVVERLADGRLWGGRRVAVVGGREESAARLIATQPNWEIVQGRFGNPPTSEAVIDIARRLSASRAEVVLVALGCPKQEVWARRLREVWPAVYVGVGGAIDTLAGVVPGPPSLLGRLGLEWLHRMVHQPSRYLPRLWQAVPQLGALLLWGLRARSSGAKGG